mgnify:CR=1 FL=1
MEEKPILEIECEECGVGGLDPVKDACGDWIGIPGYGYKCPDIICPECREYAPL